MLGRGYEITSEKEFERLRRYVRAYLMLSLPVTIAAVASNGWIGGATMLPVIIGPYALWSQLECGRMRRTEERLTLRDQAHAHSAVGLWGLSIGAGAFVVLGLVIVIVDPANWLVAGGSIAFFGICGAMSVRMIMAKRREARAPR